MKTSLAFSVVMKSPEGMILSKIPVEVVCVYGKPTVDPYTELDIPFRIKEVCANGTPVDWSLREFLINAIGGVDTIQHLIQRLDYHYERTPTDSL